MKYLVIILLNWSLLFSSLLPIHSLCAQTATATPTPSGDPKTDCKSLIGWYWNDQTNSCQKTNDPQKLNSCKNLGSPVEQQSCIEKELLNMSEAKEQDIQSDGGYEPDKWGGFDSINNVSKLPMAAVHALFVVVGLGIWAYRQCLDTSVKIMLAGALIGLATDVGTFIYLKMQLSDIKKKLEKDISENQQNFIDIQIKTFDSIASAYDKRSQVEMIRAAAYAISAAAFALATGLAAYEAYNVYSNGTAATCSASAAKSETDEATSPLKDLPAETVSLPGASETTKLALAIPIARVALAGAMTAVSAFLAYNSYKIYKQSKKQADFVRELQKSIAGTDPNANCTNRNDSAQPSCYCYLDSGERNIAGRSNSDICNKYWASIDNPKVAPKSASYGLLDSNLQKTTCVTSAQQLDPLCKCKNVKDNNSSSSCLQTKTLIQSVAAPGVSWAKDLQKNIDDTLKGNMPPALLASPQSMTKLAAKINEMNKKNVEALNKELKNSGKPTIELGGNELKKTLTNLQKEITPDVLGKIDQTFGADLGKSIQDIEASSKSSDALIKENASDKNQYENTGNKKAAPAKTGSNSLFGGGGGDSASAKVVGDFVEANKNLKYDSGINKNSSDEIWKSLSYRYQISGFNHLFVDEKKEEKKE